MTKPDNTPPSQLERDLAELKLLEIAKCYREVLDDAARKGSSMLDVLATLIGVERTARAQRALERRLREARLPLRKTLAGYDLRLQLPQTRSQDGHCAIVRLRLHPATRLCRLDRPNGNGEVASFIRIGLRCL